MTMKTAIFIAINRSIKVKESNTVNGDELINEQDTTKEILYTINHRKQRRALKVQFKV